LGLALRFIEHAKSCGADIVKFQMHLPEYESSAQELFRIPMTLQDNTRWEYWKRTSFSNAHWAILIQHCKDVGIGFCASVFSLKALEFMEENHVNFVKLGSGDLTNSELAEALARWKGELIVSTGLATYSEIRSAIESFSTLKQEGRLTVLQCTSKYPTPLNEVGINNMLYLREQYEVKIGLSDHSKGINSSIIAITLGAEVIEKHVAFSQRMFGPDISSSITFEELRSLANFRDEFPLIMNPTNKDSVAKTLEREKVLFGRSLGIKEDLPLGQALTLSDFCLRKPGGGLTWEDRFSLVGKRAIRQICRDEIISKVDFE